MFAVAIKNVFIEGKGSLVSIKELCKNRILFFDGAMGTMLVEQGLRAGELPEVYNMIHPEIIKSIHTKYVNAGADVITTNTFGANELKLETSMYTVEEVIPQAVRLAKEAAGQKLVALDIGPIGQFIKPIGTLSFERAYDIFARQVLAGAKSKVDLIIIETISDLYEAKAAVLAAKENSNLPIICTLTFQSNGRTLTGTDPLTMVNVLEGLGVDALGVNCSLGPKELVPVVEEILKFASVPVIVQPNAGLPRVANGQYYYDLSPKNYAKYLRDLANMGVRIFGGCCGTNPDFITETRELLKNTLPVKTNPKKITAVSSLTQTVVIGDGIKTVGESINPTGKNKLKTALKNNDIDYIISEAVAQKNVGADIIDINVGLPEINEKEMMVKCIRSIQEIVTLPLQIDSADPEVIEAAVRIYNGKPLINSVNGKREAMEAIFPIVKKYGACVVGLTLDENGLPETAEQRMKIAEKIIETAKEYGIKKEDVIIDCLVIPLGSSQSQAVETLDAVKLINQKFDVKTILGVSNISFGLPSRHILNRAYLSAVLLNGLDLPIINVLDCDTLGTVHAYNTFLGFQKVEEYIDYFTGGINNSTSKSKDTDMNLQQLIFDGMKEEAGVNARELLKESTPLEIIDKYLTPALAIVGEKYEKGEIFLPQLIQSSETAKTVFHVLREDLEKTEKVQTSKGKVLIATVKGDVHDIGKNIVKMLLENYGYDVIDLGKDVDTQDIIKMVDAYDIKLVGLSSLMTTTLKSMQYTISVLKNVKPLCKVMVGGAVLNNEYAGMINADYYGKDAMDAVKIANEVFGIRCL